MKQLRLKRRNLKNLSRSSLKLKKTVKQKQINQRKSRDLKKGENQEKNSKNKK